MAHSMANRPTGTTGRRFHGTEDGQGILAARQVPYPPPDAVDSPLYDERRLVEPLWPQLVRIIGTLALILGLVALAAFFWLTNAMPDDEPMLAASAASVSAPYWNWGIAVPGILLIGFVIVGSVAVLRCGRCASVKHTQASDRDEDQM